MCGIAGFIGKSTDSDESFRLATALFQVTAVRGTDASGFWGKNELASHYYKEAVPSGKLIQHIHWNNLKKSLPNLLLLHCRAASPGVGIPQFNFNNHPFVSQDETLAVIHNGNISREYQNFQHDYSCESNCDSEILLRILESKSERIQGIQEIWSIVQEGHMAVAVGEYTNEEYSLWLFRNEHRPLWVADLQDSLGQVFFCSTPEIWFHASHKFKNVLLQEIPDHEVWQFQYQTSLTISKFDVKVTN